MGPPNSSAGAIEMQGVILAAGKGSRLQPITLTRSKAMAPVVGQPLVERVMDSLSQNGVRDFILVVHEQDEEIRAYFANKARAGIELRFVPQPERLGTAHALRLAAPYLNRTFILSACDNLIPGPKVAELMTRQRRSGAAASLSLMRVSDAQVEATGIVDWRQERVWRIVEKPRLAEAPSRIASLPLYVFSTKILDYLPAVPLSARGEYELQDAIQMLIEAGHYVTGALTGSRLQLTTAQDLLALNQHFLTQANEAFHVRPAAVGPGTHLISPLRIEAGTTIGPGCVIGPRVYIEGDCQIGANVNLQDSLVLRGATIAANRHLVGEVVG
jgi:NDP-sugar pyrophosphorylase family protein